MAAHSRASIVNVPVELQANPNAWGNWLQHIAQALNSLMSWSNQPRLVPQTVATLPVALGASTGFYAGEPPNGIALPGMLAFVTDATNTGGGSAVVGGGTNKILVWYNGTDWKTIAS